MSRDRTGIVPASHRGRTEIRPSRRSLSTILASRVALGTKRSGPLVHTWLPFSEVPPPNLQGPKHSQRAYAVALVEAGAGSC